MKHYDKKLYKAEQEIKTALIILIVFITAFVLGYFLGSLEIKENQIENNKILEMREEKQSGDKRN